MSKSEKLQPQNSSPYFVSAWWDVDMFIGDYKKHKTTAKPLRNLERILGHKMHVSGRLRYEFMDKGFWKFAAYYYLDTPDPALAAYTTLKQIQPMSEWFSGFHYPFKRITEPSEDLDESTICAFYIETRDCENIPRCIQSGGVLLSLTHKKIRHFSKDYYRIRSARPVISVSHNNERANFMVTFKLDIEISNRKMRTVKDDWPTFRQKLWPEGPEYIEHFEILEPVDADQPKTIKVRKSLHAIHKHEAMAFGMTYTKACKFKLGGEDEDFFTAIRRPQLAQINDIVEIVISRI